MEKLKLTKWFLFVNIFCAAVFLGADASAAAEQPLWKDYEDSYHAHARECIIGGVMNDSCKEVADAAYEKWRNCRLDCSNVDVTENECGSPYSNQNWNECAAKVDDACTLKCKDYLLFVFVLSEDKDDSSDDRATADNENPKTSIKRAVDNQVISTLACSGETPKNSELCPGDDEEILSYAEKKLVESCSEPDVSEAKCEHICQKNFTLTDGVCEKNGFFTRILNWFKGLFN